MLLCITLGARIDDMHFLPAATEYNSDSDSLAFTPSGWG